MQLIDRLAGRAAHVAVATHDAELAERALVRLSAASTPAELELIHGLPMRAAGDVARRLHVPVRIYIPVRARLAAVCGVGCAQESEGPLVAHGGCRAPPHAAGAP